MRWRLPGHADPLVPVWTVGTWLLWEVTERSELPSGPGRRTLAGFSAVGTQNPECTGVPPPPRAADRCRLPCFPQGYSGCTSAMSAETSRCSLQTSPSMEPFQGHWAGSSPFHLKQTGGVHLPAEFTARWLANGGTREGGTRGHGQLRAGPRPVDPRELG